MGDGEELMDDKRFRGRNTLCTRTQALRSCVFVGMKMLRVRNSPTDIRTFSAISLLSGERWQTCLPKPYTHAAIAGQVAARWLQAFDGEYFLLTELDKIRGSTLNIHRRG